MTARLLGVAIAIMAASHQALAVKPPTGPLPDYDAAGGIRIDGPQHVTRGSGRHAAIQALERVAAARLRLTFNAGSGAARSVEAGRPLSPPSDGEPDSIARGFLQRHRDLWGFSAQEVDDLLPLSGYTDKHSGLTHLYYRQLVGGLPVFPATLGVHLDAQGRVLSVKGDVFPGILTPSSFRLTPEEAAVAAARHVDVRFTPRVVALEDDAVILEADGLMSPVRVTKAIYALSQPPRPAYRMVLEKNGLEWYDILVDATSGRLLHRRNLYAFAGTLTPSAPAEAGPTTPRGLVYPEHPLATTRGTGDLSRRYPYTVDPTGRPRGFANAPLFGADTHSTVPHGPDPANATLPQTVLPLPSADAPLRSSALPLSTSPQSTQGWFIPQAGEYRTIGNNVDAKDDRANDNEGSIGLRPSGGPSGDFATGDFVFQNFYGQGGDAALDLNPAVLGLFYVTNWYHDLLYHLGFTEAAGNFQQDNFGRGGKGNDFLLADAQDGSGTNNANFGTPADGASPRMQMFLWTGPDRDGDLDFDVIIHEYSHGLSNRLVGGPDNVDCLGTPLVGESGGMGEGWGDWFAAVLSDDPAVVEYSTGAGEIGIRRFPEDRTPPDWTYQFLCSGPPSNPSIPCEVHDIGELWAGILWEMREAMINRFHNRAFPGGPTFPTFTMPAGNASSNIRNAQGRTTDGSGDPAALDRAAIENATFAAMFRVVDGMKLSVCNPTMVDMRDAILAADRAAGGEFQDVIWRTFANRGIGAGAASTGGGAPVTVEDFSVPDTVADCEAAGGPLPAPAFVAVSNALNTVEITITPNGADEYLIDRGTVGAGSPIDPTPFVEVGRTTGTSFTDTGLDGGVTYFYRVRAARNEACVSSSSAVSVTAQGAALPCVVPPTFAGLVQAADAEDCEHVHLRWTPAVSNCVGGPLVTYNVYRGTDPGFTPDAGSRIASGVTGTTFTDAPGASETIYHYVVRAEDSTTGNGGPAQGGNEDGNTVRHTALLTSPAMINQDFSDDVESGPDAQHSARFSSSGLTVSSLPTRGGWFRDANPSPAAARSGSTVWHTFDPDNKSVGPNGSPVYELTSDVTSITPTSILTFHHTFSTEAAFDGGVVEAALVDPVSGLPGTFQDLGSLLYENGYNGILDAEGSDNALANRPAFTGGVLGPMKRSRAFIGALVPAGEPSASVIVRFLFGSDVANLIVVPPVVQGTYFPGWYLDDLSIDEPCGPLSAAPTGLSASASADNTITLMWSPPGSGTIAEYRIFRAEVGDVLPTDFDELVATVPGSQTTFDDETVSGGATYAYVVRAVPTTGCPSGDSNVATATATGACRRDPAFDGLASVAAPLEATCSLDLAWESAVPACAGATVRYNVYRSVDAGFTPALDNAVALGLDATGWRDRSGLDHGVTYHYIVRAEDSTVGADGPANGGSEDDNLVRRSGSPQGPLEPGPDFADDVEPAAEPGYQTASTRAAGGWAVLTDPTARSLTQSWFAFDDQPGAPTLTSKDDRLILPTMHLGTTSVMTFFHNFDFAQRPTDGAAVRHHSGGVIEISADGNSWVDLGPYIISGGYNGQLSPTAQSPLAGRAAWVGSSDAVPGTRVDPMAGHQVVVDLGAAISDPATFGLLEMPGARVRFRLGGTFQIIVGGVQGSGWGIDDLTITGRLAPGACTTEEQPACAIDTVAPGTGRQGDSLTVTLAGSGFQPGSQVIFGKDGSSADGIDEGPATVSGDGGTVTLAIAIDADASEGPHDVTVAGPDGSFCVARAAFVVTRQGGGGQTRFVSCDDGGVSRNGGWHDIADDRSATFGEYCRNVGAHKGNAGAFLELEVESENGGTVSVIYARGPRGGSARASVGAEVRLLDFFRPAVNPEKPDKSGRKDLTFGFSETLAVPAGGGTVRIEVLNDDPDANRDMATIEGFVFTENEPPAAPARFQESASASDGTVPAGGTATRTFAVPAGTVLITVVADATAGHDLAVVVRDPLGLVVPGSDTASNPHVSQTLSVLPGTYTVTVSNDGVTAAPFTVFVVPTVDTLFGGPLPMAPTP